MALFRRRKRAWVGVYESPPATEPVPLDSLVDEGMLIVSSGIRMAVKNQAILSILRDGGSFAVDWYLARVREQVAAVMIEKTADAARSAAALRASREASHGAFRDRPEDGEIERLRRRTSMLDALVERLRELSTDDDYLSATAFASRDAAWEDIGANVQAAALIRAVPPKPPLRGAERLIALQDLHLELERLGSPAGDSGSAS